LSKLVYVAVSDGLCRGSIQELLEKEEYKVESFETGDQMYIAFQDNPCDLAIIDLVMPGNSGLKICTLIRRTSNIPIVLLAEEDTDEEYADCFSHGGSFYFSKPFSLARLLIQVKVLFSNSEKNVYMAGCSMPVSFEDITICTAMKAAHCKGKDLKLTNTEYNVLLYLFERPRQDISRDAFLENIWGYNSKIDSRAIDDAIKRLRRKMSMVESCTIIRAVWGYGYRLDLKAT